MCEFYQIQFRRVAAISGEIGWKAPSSECNLTGSEIGHMANQIDSQLLTLLNNLRRAL